MDQHAAYFPEGELLSERIEVLEGVILPRLTSRRYQYLSQLVNWTELNNIDMPFIGQYFNWLELCGVVHLSFQNREWHVIQEVAEAPHGL